MPYKRAFGQLFRKYAGGKKDQEIAELTGYSQPYINQILNGRVPPAKTVTAIARKLGLTDVQQFDLILVAGHAPQWSPDNAFWGSFFQFLGNYPSDLEWDKAAVTEISPETDDPEECNLSQVQERLREAKQYLDFIAREQFGEEDPDHPWKDPHWKQERKEQPPPAAPSQELVEQVAKSVADLFTRRETEAQSRADVVTHILRRYHRIYTRFPDRATSLPDPDDGLLNLTREEADSIIDDIERDLERDERRKGGA